MNMMNSVSMRRVVGVLAVSVVVVLQCVAGDVVPDLTLYKLDSVDPEAVCIDGSPGAYYYRPGTGAGAKKLVFFFEGGGWCYPTKLGDVTDTCLDRSTSHLGSSTGYPPTMTNTGYEGGSGMLSGNSSLSVFADFATAYIKYCDGTCYTSNLTPPLPFPNSTKPLHYRGRRILDAAIDDLKAQHGAGEATEVVVSGCSAGGQACALHCDYLAQRFAPAQVKCMCDAGVFLDVVGIDGSNVYRDMYEQIVSATNSTPALPEACKAARPDDVMGCFFTQYALASVKTPTFVLNSLYSFFWSEENVQVDQPAWIDCSPKNVGITPETYAKCTASQAARIQDFHDQFIKAMDPVLSVKSPHGAFLDSCPNRHCQTSTGWNTIIVNGTLMRDAVAQWYAGKPTKLVDTPFSATAYNPTCGY